MKASVSPSFGRICCIITVTTCLFLSGSFSVSSATEAIKQPDVIAAEIQDDSKEDKEDEALYHRVTILGFVGLAILLLVALVLRLIYGNEPGEDQPTDS